MMPARLTIRELDDCDWLYARYWVDGLSIDAIGKLLGCSQPVVARRMKRHGIRIRSTAEAQTLLWRDANYCHMQTVAHEKSWTDPAKHKAMMMNRDYSKMGRPRTRRAIPCAECGRPCWREPNWFARGHTNAYCDDDCAALWKHKHTAGVNNWNWKGGQKPFYYGEDWNRQRKRALERDGSCCMICGKGPDELGRKPDVHHLFRSVDSIPVTNALDTMVSVCRYHHLHKSKGVEQNPRLLSEATLERARCWAEIHCGRLFASFEDAEGFMGSKYLLALPPALDLQAAG